MKEIFAADPDDFRRPAGPVAESRIVAAEQELGLRFPVSYRTFLRDFGAGSFGELHIHGLFSAQELDPDYQQHYDDVVYWTQFERAGHYGLKPIPGSWIYFAGDENGARYYLDTSREVAGDAPVLIQGFTYPLQTLADSFEDMLFKLDHSPLYDIAEQYAPRSPVKTHEDPNPAPGRLVDWIQLVPDPCPPELSKLAQHFAVDPATLDVFVFAKSTDLDLEKQLEAFGVAAAYFANPVEDGQTKYPYISLDYLIAHHPELPQAFLFPQLKQVVLDAYNSR